METYANYVATTGYGRKKLIKVGFMDNYCNLNEGDKDKINYNHLGAVI